MQDPELMTLDELIAEVRKLRAHAENLGDKVKGHEKDEARRKAIREANEDMLSGLDNEKLIAAVVDLLAKLEKVQSGASFSREYLSTCMSGVTYMRPR